VKISVVTATFNAARDLPALVQSLRNQTDKDFEWVVADGCSTDGTVGILRQAADINVTILEAEDFGIYDALNRAIKASSGDYYIVAGADDVFEAGAIALFRAAADGNFDFISAKARYKDFYLSRRNQPSWLVGAWAYVSCHAVGCMIRKDLHERFGYYSKLFPLAADQLFIKHACQQGARVREVDFVAGEFGSGGLSSVNTLVHLTDTFKVQYMTERRKWLQVLLFFLRVVKNRAQSRI
jgi:glycosyltransferase involved in cell wall biosynthesis